MANLEIGTKISIVVRVCQDQCQSFFTISNFARKAGTPETGNPHKLENIG